MGSAQSWSTSGSHVGLQSLVWLCVDFHTYRHCLQIQRVRLESTAEPVVHAGAWIGQFTLFLFQCGICWVVWQ